MTAAIALVLAYYRHDIVRYTDFLGGVREVMVTAKMEHNGRRAFEGILIDTDGQAMQGSDGKLVVWGYEYQITKVWDMSDEPDH